MYFILWYIINYFTAKDEHTDQMIKCPLGTQTLRVPAEYPWNEESNLKLNFYGK